MTIGMGQSGQGNWLRIDPAPTQRCYRCYICGLFGDLMTPTDVATIQKCNGDTKTYKQYIRGKKTVNTDPEGFGWYQKHVETSCDFWPKRRRRLQQGNQYNISMANVSYEDICFAGMSQSA
eukprot:22175_1